jgi:hypothetical protein
MCSDLLENGVEVEIMWIPAHLELEGNETVDEWAWNVALKGVVFKRPLLPVDFQGLARSLLLRKWQWKWDTADTGRFAHSILPKGSLRPWFEGQREDRKFVSTVSRIMFGHCTARSHLSRFRIVEGAVRICLKDYETVDHLIWYCERLERRRLTDALTALDVQLGICVLWRSGQRWSAVWISWEVLELEFDDLAVLFQEWQVKYYLGP